MYSTININDYVDVTIEFDKETRENMIKGLKHSLSKDFYTEEQYINLEKALEMFNPKGYYVDIDTQVKIKDIEVYDDDIVEAYNRISLNNDEETYQDGYDDAKEEQENMFARLKQKYSMLLWKIQQMSDGLKENEKLNKRELEQLRELLEFLYD